MWPLLLLACHHRAPDPRSGLVSPLPDWVGTNPRAVAGYEGLPMACNLGSCAPGDPVVVVGIHLPAAGPILIPLARGQVQPGDPDEGPPCYGEPRLAFEAGESWVVGRVMVAVAPAEAALSLPDARGIRRPVDLIWRVDLDYDGLPEEIVEARGDETLGASGQTLWSTVGIRRLDLDGRRVIVPLVQSTVRWQTEQERADALPTYTHASFAGLTDSNLDGLLEVVVDLRYGAGAGMAVYDAWGRRLGETGC